MILTERQELKIELFNRGIQVSEKARMVIEGTERKPLSTGDYASTSGLTLDLGEDIFVNAPIVDNNPNIVSGTPHQLDIDGDRFVVRTGDREIQAKYIPVPGYYNRVNSRGEPYKLLAVTHIDRVRISPVEGCAIACQFCDVPYEFKYRKHNIEDLVDSIKVAVCDPILPAQHVLISGGTPKREDYGYENEVYQQVTSSFPGLDVDIMMAPVGALLNPKLLKEIGIHGLSINLELFNPEIARRKAKGKYDIGREKYLKFISDCVEMFGPGKVRSLLMVGIEPMEDTLQGVHALAERGCDPVLSPFIPDSMTPLRNELPPSIDLQKEIFQRARDIVDVYTGVVLGPRCIPCQHNTLAFPYKEGSFYRHSYNPNDRQSINNL